MEGSAPDGNQQPVDITFTDAYDELKRITETLNSSDTIAPERLLELLKRGKGLEHVLRQHLDEVEQQVRSIEAGDSYVQFRIVTSSTSSAAANRDTQGGPASGAAADTTFAWDGPDGPEVPVLESNSGFIPAAPGKTGVADDDIPF